jgi:hypothetical protein
MLAQPHWFLRKGVAMTPELFRQVGEALHGSEWRMPLSRDLGVNYLTIRRWQSAAAPIPPGVVDELRRLLVEKIADQTAVLAALQAALAAINTRQEE